MKKEKPINLNLITPQRAKELEQEINALEKMLRNDKALFSNPKIQDEAEFRKQINKRKKELEEFSPTKYTGQLANKRYAQAKRLKQIIQNAMPSKKMYFQKQYKDEDSHNKYQDFERAVQQQIRFQTDPKIQKAVHLYKHIMSRLDPSDPTIRNIESLRK